MNEKILSIQEFESVRERLAEINSNIVKFDGEIESVINTFESEPVVQQFYASGKYGSDIKERLQQVKVTMKEYFNIISNGSNSLVSQTSKYVNDQIDLLSRSGRGYSTKESISQRRVGNQG